MNMQTPTTNSHASHLMSGSSTMDSPFHNYREINLAGQTMSAKRNTQSLEGKQSHGMPAET